MYRPPSPPYEVPELPSLRRVKPLPKRRRTSDPRPDDDEISNATHAGAGEQDNSPDHTDADEPPAHDPSLAAQMALQAYYMPVLGGVRDLFKNTTSRGVGHANASGKGAAIDSIDLSGALSGVLGYSGPGGGGSADGQDDEDGDGDGDGDYVDHLQQPGNTKKRKVPANMSGSADGHDAGSTGSGAEDELLDRGHPSNRERDADADSVSGAGSVAGGGGGGTQYSMGRNGLGTLLGKKGKLSRATLIGLQHKEMLKSRKRQLAAVIGALPHGDTLALDQALSASTLFLKAQAGGDPRNAPPPRVRLSRRRAPRIARALKAWRESHPLPDKGDEDEAPVAAPCSDFTYECHSATSDRLVATTEQVALLHSQFEAEFARQAAKAAEAAKQAQAALNGPLAKRSTAKQAARTTGTNDTTDQKGALDQSLLATKGKGGKKKKRSALANASNPHHLRNYVPSRLPHTGPPSAQQAVQNAQNLLTPLPLRFLSAEIPPRRRKKSEPAVTPIPTLTNPADEWICPFCEYELFYGDDTSYHRAVRNRKKILRRRRRARERAAAAASGVAPAAAASGGAESEDVHPGFETPAAPAPAGASAKENAPASGGKQAKWKEGDRGGHGTGVAAHA
ncbi:hypothetical protein K466DRAFT_520836 [Polyporus arcularius HHB13444]|uniref:Uncharacterized protein n=1 Tax=Polyporus arcularius HHB13444 TaxID=1314778 RepID=A0A5C3PGP3_9APHY|nr:hypothetical protein K466DRAFT_520836 [Polyporus arcularius HHB13444]